MGSFLRGIALGLCCAGLLVNHVLNTDVLAWVLVVGGIFFLLVSLTLLENER